MKKALLSFVFLAVFLFSACAARQPLPLEPITAPTASHEEKPEPTVPTIPPTTEPTVPETEPPLPSGAPVTLQGTDVGSFLDNNTLYVRAADYADALLPSLSVSGGALALDGEALSVPVLSRQDGDYVPVLELSQALGFGVLVDDSADGSHIFVTPAAGEVTLPQGITVPVLMYHAVSDDIWGIEELFVSPDRMDAQLAYLAENGYDPIFFSDLPHVEDYDKPVLLTFDDGYDDNYENLYPLLQKYNMKATIFIISDVIGGSHKMTAEQIQELSRSGLVSIQSHSASHPYLNELSEEELIQEMERSRLVITRLTGIQPEVLCYPSGKTNSLVQEVTARYYNYGVIMGPAGYQTGDNAYTIGRHYVSRTTDLYSFAAMVSAAGEKS